MGAPSALAFVPSRVFMLYPGDNRIQAYSTKNRPVFGLGSSFGEPQLCFVESVDVLAKGAVALKGLETKQLDPWSQIAFLARFLPEEVRAQILPVVIWKNGNHHLIRSALFLYIHSG